MPNNQKSQSQPELAAKVMKEAIEGGRASSVMSTSEERMDRARERRRRQREAFVDYLNRVYP
jgi:hypothetical protein